MTHTERLGTFNARTKSLTQYIVHVIGNHRFTKPLRVAKMLCATQVGKKGFGEDVKNVKFLMHLCTVVIMCHLLGCGYTILKTSDADAIQAEWAAIDSTHHLPDLTIASVEYEHSYHQGPQNSVDPIDNRGFHTVTFHLTIENIGNADYHAPYTVVFIKENPRPSEINTFYGMAFNKHADTIRVGDKQEIELENFYPFLKSSYNFVILTNPIIQHKIVEELNYHTHAPPIPLARESRYDNNNVKILIPALEDLLHGG